ncbi:MAG: ATP-binding protein [Desulfuromonadales bacterium]|nr:ATP-binding protein [Desulfuromonadales bacterium]
MPRKLSRRERMELDRIKWGRSFDMSHVVEEQTEQLGRRVDPPRDSGRLISMPVKPVAPDGPFADDLEHLQALEQEATLRLLVHVVRSRHGLGPEVEEVPRQAERSSPAFCGTPSELREELQKVGKENRRREELTLQAGQTLKFLDLCNNYQLDPTERLYVQLLLLHATAPGFRKRMEDHGLVESSFRNREGLTVGLLLELTCQDYRQQLADRRYFSVDGALVRNDLIEFESQVTEETNILSLRVSLQNSCVRFCLNDHNLYNATFRFVRREMGKTRLEQVVLPEQIKEEVVGHIGTFFAVRASDHAAQLDAFYGYGTGLAMIFHGPSGTGKTMLAQALSHHFQRPLFYMTEQNLQDMPSSYEEAFQIIFREANLHGGLVFFDEADDLFQEGSHISRELLVALEKSHCVTILATNKPVELDPAMERRLGMKVAFTTPDVSMRRQIWQSLLPSFIDHEPDIDLTALAQEFPFSGGLIKNALVMAISRAYQESLDHPRLSQAHLQAAARLQLQQATIDNPLCATVDKAVAVEELGVAEQTRQQLLRLGSVCQQARDERLPLLINLHDQAGCGLDAAIALASQARLKATLVDLSSLMRLQESREKIKDRASQKEVDPLDLVFDQAGRDGSLLILHDPHGVAPLVFKSEQVDKKYLESDLKRRLERDPGLCCLVTAEKLNEADLSLFDATIELLPLDTGRQVEIWRKILPKDVLDDGQLLALVEQYPLPPAKIGRMIQRARVRNSLASGRDGIEYSYLQQVLSQHFGVEKTVLLFGDHDE